MSTSEIIKITVFLVIILVLAAVAWYAWYRREKLKPFWNEPMWIRRKRQRRRYGGSEVEPRRGLQDTVRKA